MLGWYQEHGRKDLPWQIDSSPYHTWLSEIMLQQTQVKTVLPYYQSFKTRFPDIHSLAQASIDEVLHLWTGLGYYTRARNLHKCAQIVSSQYQGQFPDTLEQLEALPGIGRSTAGAILSLSMDIPAPILDGNVKRVLCRFFCIEGWSGTSSVQKQLWQVAERLMPEKQVKAYNQSLMDLGATICKRSKPLCEACPLAPQCEAYQSGQQALFPQAKPKKTLPQKHCHMLILQNKKGQVLLEQRPSQGLWGGLWSLPEFSDLKALQKHCQQQQWKITEQSELEPVKHTFSHFQLFIHPVLCKVSQEPARIGEAKTLWYQAQKQQIGLAAPVKKLIERVQL